MSDELVQNIDAILPQTQCGLCDHGGCKPYAKAIVGQGANIDRCPPGGVETLIKLADITKRDATPLIEGMREKEKPPLRAVIREADCIGCTKCIQACPVDAIIGRSKRMHTVIESECTGCELCIVPCPVDCIELVEVDEKHDTDKARKRYQNRNDRLEKERLRKLAIKKDRKQKRVRAEIAAVMSRANEKRKTRNIDEQRKTC